MHIIRLLLLLLLLFYYIYFMKNKQTKVNKKIYLKYNYRFLFVYKQFNFSINKFQIIYHFLAT
jgi:hypothetical protein